MEQLSRLVYSRDLLKITISDALKTSSHKHSHSAPALLQRGKSLPQDIDIFEITARGDFDLFKQLWSCTTGAGRYLIVNKRNESKKTILHVAAEKGHFNFVSYLVEKCSADINAVDKKLYTPLHYAANFGRSEIIYYLIKQGANISMFSDTKCLPLFYYVRQHAETNILIGLAVVSLLIPHDVDINTLNYRGQSILHYACMNVSPSMPATVMFLIENGAYADLRDSKNCVCWDYLNSPHEDVLGRYTTITKTEGKRGSIYSSANLPLIPQFPINKFEDEFKESPQQIALRNITKIKELVEKIKSGENASEFELIKKRVEKSIAALASQTNINLRPQSITSLGVNAFDFVYEALNFSNKSARKLLREGRVMSYKGIQSHKSIYFYYLLCNDSLILFDEDHIQAKIRGDNVSTYREPKVFPFFSLRIYSIPNGFGLMEGVQVVFIDNLFCYSRKSFTFLFPSDEEKRDFMNDVITSSTYNSISFNITPTITNEKEVIKQGYLIKQGTVVKNYSRVYVRLTRTTLYYYDNPDTPKVLGTVPVESLVNELDEERLMIKWSDVAHDRNYYFFCENRSDFLAWTSDLRGNKGGERKSSRKGSIPREMEVPKQVKSLIVTITINSGRGLAAKDLNGKSDPYCLVGLCRSNNQFLGKPHKTPKVKKTLQPMWKKKNTFTFEPVNNNVALGIRVECWDHDYTSSHDFMGVLILDPPLFKVGTSYASWFKLHPENGEEVSGDLHITITTREK